LVLDLGCHSGALRDFLPSNTGYIGIDISDDALKKQKFDAVCADVSYLPFKDNVFDCVFAVEVLEHLYSPRKCVKEVWRILKHGGEFIVSVPNLAMVLNRLKILLGKHPHYIGYDESHHHLRAYVSSSLDKLLQSVGFVIEKRKSFFCSSPPRSLWIKLKLFNRIGVLTARRFPNLADRIYRRARKV